MGLIDKKTTIKAFEELQDCYNGFSDTYDKACIIGVIDEISEVDAVEVVRYKNCALWDDAVFCFDWQDQPLHYCHGSDKITHAEFFCANAERRTKRE